MSRPDRVVIVGRDAALWLAVLTLYRALGRTGVSLTAVELPSLLHAHDHYAGLPSMEPFHGLLGIGEAEVLRATEGAFSLGQSFANFSRAQPPFFHGYGVYGAPINNVPFVQVWTQARQAGMKAQLEDFSLNATAARQGRFFVPNDEINAFGRCDYAYHLHAQAYVRYLKTRAAETSVPVHVTRRIETVRGEAGLDAIVLADGQSISGDIFIDASGAESLLLDQAMGVPFDSWQHWFSGDRLLSVSASRLPVLPAYSQVRAVDTGVLHLTPLQDRVCVTRTYHASEISDEEALQSAAVVSGLHLNDGAVISPLVIGRSVRAWEGNVIALGDAACTFDPIDNVSLHALQMGLAHLVNLFPLDRDAAAEREEYNRTLQVVFERLRDFQCAHFKLNRIMDKPFWDHVRRQDAPDELAWKIELFQARGVVAMYDEESFESESWNAILIGHGIVPRSFDPMAGLLPQDGAVRSVQRMLGFISQQVQAMGTLDQYLQEHGARAPA